MIGSTDALCAILENPQIVFFGYREDSIQLARIALQMHGHDQLRLGRNQRFDCVRIDVERMIDLGADRQGAR